MIFIGMAMIVLAPIISMSLAQPMRSSGVKFVGGGCVVIAFVPICFGTGMGWIPVILLAVVAFAIVLIMYIVVRTLVRGVGFEPTQAYASGSLTRSRRS